MINQTPLYRDEKFIDAILNGTDPPKPITREEYYLAKIAGAEVEIPSPVFNKEFFLAKIAGADIALPEPITREEIYLASICGENVDIPVPAFRIEYWLSAWVDASKKKRSKDNANSK